MYDLDRRKCKSIKGDPEYVCMEIYKRVIVPREDVSGNILYDQVYEIGIDIGGEGILYKRILNDIGLKTYDIRGKNINTVLPIRVHDVPRYKKLDYFCEQIERFDF